MASPTESDFFESIRDLAGLSVLHSDFVVVTGERAGRSLYAPLTSLLRRVRTVVDVDVVFVAQFLGDTPAVRHRQPSHGAAPEPDPAEVEFGTMVLSRPGTRGPGSRCIAAAVVAEDGRDFGTVCCHPGSRPARPDLDLAGIVRSTARIVALALARAQPAPQACEAEPETA